MRCFDSQESWNEWRGVEFRLCNNKSTYVLGPRLRLLLPNWIRMSTDRLWRHKPKPTFTTTARAHASCTRSPPSTPIPSFCRPSTRIPFHATIYSYPSFCRWTQVQTISVAFPSFCHHLLLFRFTTIYSYPSFCRWTIHLLPLDNPSFCGKSKRLLHPFQNEVILVLSIVNTSNFSNF